MCVCVCVYDVNHNICVCLCVCVFVMSVTVSVCVCVSTWPVLITDTALTISAKRVKLLTIAEDKLHFGLCLFSDKCSSELV